MDIRIAAEETPNLRLFLLGGFRAELAGVTVSDAHWKRSSPRSLVKLLAITPGQRLHREQIQEMLWPHLQPDSAANSFRKALHLARHALEPELASRGTSRFFQLSGNVVALAGDPVWVDADQFRALAHAALASSDEGMFLAALAVYGGELLAEDRYADWATSQRDALAQLHLSVLIGLAEALEGRHAYTAAIERLHTVLELDPIQEVAHRHLMRLYVLSGVRHQALRQYQTCCEVLSRELDTRPAPETEALHREILAGGIAPSTPSTFPPIDDRPALPALLSRAPRTPAVGRSREMTLLRDRLADATSGRGTVVLVGGEAGVGKTRLVAEMAREAGRHGALVLWGASHEQEGTLPYGPFVEALDRYLAHRSAVDRARFASDHSGLRSLLPSLEAQDPSRQPTMTPESERARLFRAVARFLGQLAIEQPLVLVLDDLQSADEATLQLLHYLARHAVEHRWLILGTYRDADEASQKRFQQLHASVTRDGLGDQFELPRLHWKACNQLIRGLLPGRIDDVALFNIVYSRSLGNPLFTQELVHALQERGCLSCVDGHWRFVGPDSLGVPRRIHELLADRIDQLGAEVGQALAVAAVVGMESTFELLRAAGDLSDGMLLDALDRGLAARVIEERGDGYAFKHPLLRAVLYERLSRQRRMYLHAAIAAAIEHGCASETQIRSETIAALAHHWDAAGDPGRAVPYLIRAGEHAAQVYANTEAIERFRRALQLLDGASPAIPNAETLRLDAQERLGDVLALAGEQSLARDAYLDGAAVASGVPLVAARLQRKAAKQTLLIGDVETAHDLLKTATAQLAVIKENPEVDLERTRLLAVTAHGHWLAYRFQDALAVAGECAHLAETIGATTELAQAYEMMALACLPLGDWHGGAEYERRYSNLVDLNHAVAEIADVHL